MEIRGAILGIIASSAVDLALCRWQIDLPLRYLLRRSTFPARALWAYIGPLFLAAVSARLYDRLDLFALQALGGTDAQTGWYAAAQNLALLPAVFAASFTPLLLSTLTRLRRTGQDQAATRMARQALRLVLCLLPLGGIVAGSSVSIVCFISGPAYAAAGPLLAWLMFAALASVMISTGSSMLVAVDRPFSTILICGALPPVALVGHLLLIPQLGPVGAAISSTAAASLGAAVAVGLVWRFWRVLPPLATLCRSILLCVAAWFIARHWPVSNAMLIPKLIVLTIVVAAGLVLSGELPLSWIAKRRAGISQASLPSERIEC